MRHVAGRPGLAAAVLVVLWIAATPAAAQAPFDPGVRLRGTLTTLDGSPQNDLTTIVVTIHNAPTGGTPLYREQFTVMVTMGSIDLVLGVGFGTPTGDLFSALTPTGGGDVERYLALQVEPDPQMMPRRRITASPYALLAMRAADATQLGGVPAASYLTQTQLTTQLTNYATTSTLNNYVTVNSQTTQNLSGDINFQPGATVTYGNTTGTPPFMVSSTTLVTNFNADLLDGVSAGSFARTDIANLFQQDTVFEAATSFEGQTTFAAAQGTPPFIINSTTQVNNLNAAQLNGLTAAQIAASVANFSGALAGDVSGNQGATSVVRVQGRSVASTAPTAGQVLTWNDTNNRWQPGNPSVASNTGGDLAGALDNAMVIRLQGRALASTAPASGQAIVWNGSQWEPTTIPVTGGGGGTVTSIGAGTGITSSTTNPITTAGALSIDTAVVPRLGTANTFAATQTATGFAATDTGAASITTAGGVSAAGAVSAGSFSGSGAALTALNASALSSGTVGDGRLTANICRLDTAQTFATTHTFLDQMLALRNAGNTFSTLVRANGATAARTITLPDVDGTAITTGNLSSINAVGTVASGVWNGTAIAPSRGGVGIDTSATPAQSLLRTTGPGAWATLPVGTDGQVLKIVSGAINWGTDNAGAGGGTVTSVGVSTGITSTANPITISGTLSIDTAVVPRLGTANTFTAAQTATSFTATNNTATSIQTPGGVTATGAVSAGSFTTAGSVTAASFSGSGASLTGLPAVQLTGANLLPDGVLSTNVPRLNTSNAFTGAVSATSFSTGGTVTASTFSGSGASLTGLPAVQLTGAGLLPDGVLSTNVPRLNTANTFTNTVAATSFSTAGTVSASTFSGSGASLTGLPAAQLTGTNTLPDGVLSTNVPRLNAANVFSLPNTFNSTVEAGGFTTGGTVTATTFSGSGASLTGLPAAQLTGTVSDGLLSANIPKLNVANIFSQANTFSGTTLQGSTSIANATITTGTALLTSATIQGGSAILSTATISGGQFNNGSFGNGTFDGTHTGNGEGLSGLSKMGVRKMRGVPPNAEGCRIVNVTPTVDKIECAGEICDQAAGAANCEAITQASCRKYCIWVGGGVEERNQPHSFNDLDPGAFGFDDGELTFTQTAPAVVCRVKSDRGNEVPVDVTFSLRYGSPGTLIGTAHASLNEAPAGSQLTVYRVLPTSTITGSVQMMQEYDGAPLVRLFMDQTTSKGLCFLAQTTRFNLRFMTGKPEALGNE